MFSVPKKLFKTFVAAFASAIEGPGSSCSSSISEDESTIELFFSFTNAAISSSLTSPADQKVPPFPGWHQTRCPPGEGGEIETAKSLAYCSFVPLMGLAATLTKVE
ncbi:hypothetical protein AVEN_229919-1 [Araneus ventricosus]|uniref:Uncharacterized protein n=1 Tax=Araneus ventricosus TaxID=182803 RepID=A0A4Y2BYC3_ARAVE|nr:hypothetical protein AVEN_229919-1 [Araneus ventricosus]